MFHCSICGLVDEHRWTCPKAPHRPKPAPSAEPDLSQRLLAFMRESDEWGTPDDVMRSAREAGLTIVPAADVMTAEERKVLEACAALEKGPLTSGTMVSFWPAMAEVCRAELARRAAKERP